MAGGILGPHPSSASVRSWPVTASLSATVSLSAE